MDPKPCTQNLGFYGHVLGLRVGGFGFGVLEFVGFKAWSVGRRVSG